MVEKMIEKLIQHNSFWAQSISPCMKFITAQKMICCGVSFSAFQDNSQMCSTARMCFVKLIRGFINVLQFPNAISDCIRRVMLST